MTEVPNNRIASSGFDEESLTTAERTEIDHELTHYPHKQAATIEALKIVQNHQRWVSDGKLKAIAAYLEISPEAVESVATFYNKIYRLPVGQQVVGICNSVTCWSLGYQQLMDQACSTLNVVPGEASAGNRFTVLPAPCLGACDKAPVMMVEDQLIERVTPDILARILTQESDT
jgi:NADH-quinone oxidoreductase subunit E